MTRILIADDHAIMRQGIKQILEDEFPDIKSGEAGTTMETLEALWKESWDVLILDINMPGRGGLEVLDEVRRGFPKLPVLVLSSTPEDQLALRVLKAGASGYLNKQTAPEELVGALRKLLAGGRYVSAKLAETLAREIGRPTRPLHESLSGREYEVLEQMVRGRSLKEIAGNLSLSVKTISTFRGRIFEKLQVANDFELAAYVHQNALFL